MIEPGRRFGTFEVLRALGAGGMGEVYLARDLRLGRDVALKFLPDAVAQDSHRLARFEREARLLAVLNHPGIASIYGLETDADGVRFLVLELVPGETLAERLKRGPLPIREALEIGRQIAEALAAAHAAGVVHRDLKCANVKYTPSGTAKVLDFGLAKALGEEEPSSALDVSATASLTTSGMILGTPACMSPEQARGQAVDERTDVWSFGCVLYECLTRKPAFEGETASDVIAAVLTRDPDWRRLPRGLPAAARRLLGRCLQRDRQRRLHHIADARLELEEALAAPPSPRKHAMVVGAVVLVGVCVGAGAFWVGLRPDAPPDTRARTVEPRATAAVSRGVRPVRGLSSLSGYWVGTQHVDPLKTCGVRDRERPATLKLEVSPDGEVRGRDNARHDWSGAFGDDKQVAVRVSGSSICGDRRHEWSADYAGAIVEEAGTPVLEMKGVEEWCPPNCVFSSRYRLQRRDRGEGAP